MKIIDKSKQFKDNVYTYKSRRRILWHWTGGVNASGAIDYLDSRHNGKGTVGYNYIIDKNGYVYMLVDPYKGFMQSSGLGKTYDETVIAIAFAMLDESDDITKQQIESGRYLLNKLNQEFEIFENIHHAAINPHKVDFPNWLWEEIKEKLDIR